MSRYTIHGPRYGLSYGVDHDPIIGTFVMVWDKTICPEPDADSVLVDLDGFTTTVTPEMIVELAQHYDVPIDLEEVRADLSERPEPMPRNPRIQNVLDHLLDRTMKPKPHGDA